MYCLHSTSLSLFTDGVYAVSHSAPHLIPCSRNLALSLAAGNATIWKPSHSTPLCSVAVTKIVTGVLEKNGLPGAVAGLVTGGRGVGEAIVESEHVDMGMDNVPSAAGVMLMFDAT